VANSLLFSTLTYSLRDFSRARLTDILTRRGKLEYVGPTLEHTNDLIFVTAVFRLFSNILVLVGVLLIFYERSNYAVGWRYLFSILITGAITLFCSVIVPHALSRHAAEQIIASFVSLLNGLRAILMPVTKVMHHHFAINTSKERLRAFKGFLFSLLVRAEYYPANFHFASCGNHFKNCSTASDLDVITMRAETEKAKCSATF